MDDAAMDEDAACGRAHSFDAHGELLDHQEQQQALKDAQLQRTFQEKADAGVRNTTFASPQEVRHGPRKELPAYAGAPGETLTPCMLGLCSAPVWPRKQRASRTRTWRRWRCRLVATSGCRRTGRC
jgi:hypothetical protein